MTLWRQVTIIVRGELDAPLTVKFSEGSQKISGILTLCALFEALHRLWGLGKQEKENLLTQGQPFSENPPNVACVPEPGDWSLNDRIYHGNRFIKVEGALRTKNFAKDPLADSDNDGGI